MTTAARAHLVVVEDLTEEVVFPLVRRRPRRVEMDDDERATVARPPSKTRMILVQTMGLLLFVGAVAVLVMALVR